ncbi:hypothetical protein Hamer_G031287 [Homarus americanus]|uniref:Uncharacterized protein n=1 Tax=Homarus americanus TaxID=6706 RepID=A0A8J5MXI7_HOMAM|nr:hypothetical protein Hamer_G031287 [Homarus americanus]
MLQMSEIWTSPIQVPQKREMCHLQPKPHDRNVYSETQRRNHHDSPNCGKKHHAWSTSCPERRERIKVAMAKVQPQNRTEAPQTIFVWGQQRQNIVNPTPTPPQLSEDSFPALPPPGYRTKLKTPGRNQSMQETMTNQWTPQPQLQSCVQNTPVLVENTILPRTLQPLQATTQLNTPPACQSTSGIHRRTNKTDDHYYGSDFLYDNAETRYQHRKYNKCSYDTAPRNDAGRPDSQNSTTTSGTDEALETDIRQEEELAIQEITQNRETSSPLQQITRIRTTNTDRQQTHDHRQERQHPEERRKNSRHSTSCSSLRAGAQETATTPNGRGGKRLD